MGIFGPTGVAQQRQSPRYRNNCANFVSQALLAGGLETTEQWRPSGMEPWLSKSGNHAAYAESASLAWMNVKAQYLYFSNPEHGYTASPVVNLYGENGTSIAGMTNVSINTIGDVYAAGVREGDPIYFYSLDQNGEPTPAHAAMVSSVKSNELAYTANTASRFNQDIWTAITTEEFSGAYIVKIEI